MNPKCTYTDEHFSYVYKKENPPRTNRVPRVLFSTYPVFARGGMKTKHGGPERYLKINRAHDACTRQRWADAFY
jgi:hypothetical protein